MINREIFDRYGLLNLPRTFGFPSQIPLRSVSQLETLIKENEGKFPLYISVNSHDSKWVNLGQIYFDLDGHGEYTIDDALKDQRKLAEYFDSQKVDFLMDFTGRGFRLLLKVKPQIMEIKEAKEIMKGYTKHIKESLNIKTLDLKVAEPMRIMRVPLTTYVYQDKERKYIKTKRHVLPIDMDMLFNSDTQELLHYSEVLKFKVMDLKYRRIDISEISEYRERVNYETRKYDECMEIDFLKISDYEFLKIMEEIFRNISNVGTDLGPDNDLIQRLLTKHPQHTDRFIACVKLKESVLRPDYRSAISFFDRLSSLAKWDNRNLDVQAKQIMSIYRGNYGVKKNDK